MDKSKFKLILGTTQPDVPDGMFHKETIPLKRLINVSIEKFNDFFAMENMHKKQYIFCHQIPRTTIYPDMMLIGSNKVCRFIYKFKYGKQEFQFKSHCLAK